MTTYTVAGSDKDFLFVTIHLAGHMVTTFQAPAAALAFLGRFLGKQPVACQVSVIQPFWLPLVFSLL